MVTTADRLARERDEAARLLDTLPPVGDGADEPIDAEYDEPSQSELEAEVPPEPPPPPAPAPPPARDVRRPSPVRDPAKARVRTVSPSTSPRNTSKAPQWMRTLLLQARYLPLFAAGSVVILDFFLVLGEAVRDGLEHLAERHGGQAALDKLEE